MAEQLTEAQPFDPITALDQRSGPRDRRQGDTGTYNGPDRRGGSGDRRRGGRINRQRGMSRKAKIIALLAIALICSLGTAHLINVWFEGELARYKNSMATAQKTTAAPAMAKVVVAAKQITYGAPLEAGNLKVINWQADAVPPGAFTSIGALLAAKGERQALMTIEANEPVLPGKITKPGRKASLSEMLGDGNKAVTIRVNDVIGIAGLIKPGDRVDVLWTRTRGDNAGNKEPYTDILVRDVKVLALDQKVVEGENKTFVAKAVTIEVSLNQAQRVALGGDTGKLQLALRGTADISPETARRINVSRLGLSQAQNSGDGSQVIVTRGLTRKTYAVRPAVSRH